MCKTNIFWMCKVSWWQTIHVPVSYAFLKYISGVTFFILCLLYTFFLSFFFLTEHFWKVYFDSCEKHTNIAKKAKISKLFLMCFHILPCTSHPEKKARIFYQHDLSQCTMAQTLTKIHISLFRKRWAENSIFECSAHGLFLVFIVNVERLFYIALSWTG